MSATGGTGRGGIAMSFLADLSRTARDIEVTTPDSAPLPLPMGLALGIDRVERSCAEGNKLMFIGNGGSAAIASHQAIDYWKNGGLTALAFNDGALLTCLSNDYGYERVFAEPIRQFGRPGDGLVAISSSGCSPNILRAVEAARETGCWVMTLSGFEGSNPLRRAGDLNFYVGSKSYGIVEITHLSLLHAMLEESMVSRGRH